MTSFIIALSREMYFDFSLQSLQLSHDLFEWCSRRNLQLAKRTLTTDIVKEGTPFVWLEGLIHASDKIL